MKSRLPFRRRFMFTAITLAFVFLAVELVCQTVYRLTVGDFLFRRASLPIYEADDIRCYRLKSGLEYAHRTNEFDIVVYSNSQGMRTDENRQDVSYEKAPGTYRILFMGPSFTFGWGNSFDDAYPTIIGELLRQNGREVEIINLGMPSQGVLAQICWLAKAAKRFDPDMVVQTTYGDGVSTVIGECPEDLACPTVVDSALYGTPPTVWLRFVAQVKNLGTVFYGYYAYQSVIGAAPTGDRGMGKEFHDERARTVIRDYGTLLAGYHRYEALVDRSLGEDVAVAHLFLPVSFVVHPEDSPRWEHVMETDPLGARKRIREAISVLRAEGLVVIDPTEALIRRSSRGRLYYWLDIHLTPAGNLVVAEEAVPQILDLMDSAGD